MNIFWLLFSFKGRIGRIAYAGVAFGVPLVMLVFMLIAANMLGIPLPKTAEDVRTTVEALQPLLGPLFLVDIIMFWIGLAALVKRLHDIGKSGWLYLYILIGFFVSGFVRGLGAGMQSAPVLVVGGILLLIVTLYMLWIILQVLFCKGDADPNDYGAPGGGSDEPAKSPALRNFAPKQAAGLNLAPKPMAGLAIARPASSGFGKRR